MQAELSDCYLRITPLVHTVDLQATLIELFGFSHTAPRDGVSFAWPLTRSGPRAPEREWVYCERGKPNGALPFAKWIRTIRHKDGYKLTVREVKGEVTEELWLPPDEETPVANAAKADELRKIMDSLTE